MLAHRFAYELLVGPIPEGMELDHRSTCPKRCVNPAHVRPTTHKQNHENRAGATVNSSSGVRGVVWNKRKKTWQAYMKHHQKGVYVGQFAVCGPGQRLGWLALEQAEAAVIAKRNELFTHNDADRTVHAI